MNAVGSHNASSNTLILQVFALDASDLVIEGVFDYIVYRRNPDNPNILERVIQADAVSSRVSGSRVLADDVTAVVFAYFDQNNQPTSVMSTVANVSFSITSQRQSVFRAGQPFQETFTSWAKLRNKTG